jgi:predicted phage terminase large subunit-like protein
MAWINEEGAEYEDGTWLEYEERAELIAQHEREQVLLAKLLKAGKATAADLDRLEFLIDELKRLNRIHRGEQDVLYFGMQYFSEDENPGNADNMIPEGTNYNNAVDFHRELCSLFDDITKGIQKKNVAWAVPRQHAKTAWISNIFLLHQVVYRKKRYVVLFSETTDVAGDFISWGRYQLKLNEKLRNDFGELLHVKPSMNDLDNKYEYITRSNTKVEAKGLGTQTRGLRHGNTRPDLFILDDLESDDSTNTPELIEKSKSWFKESMLPAKAKDGLCVYLGTILCYGSLLHYVVEDRKDFESRKFSAIESYADREDLWEQWRKIYRSDDPEAAEKAEAFFLEHEDEMLEGTKILWPGYWTYYELVQIRENDGIKAFNQEYQNNPTDEERQIFKPEYFVYFNEDELEGKNLEFFGGIDFAMGKENGDYSVIATVAKNMDTGVCYVYDVFMERCHPDRLLEKAVELTLKYQYSGIGVEAQMAQEWFADKLREELQRQGYPSHTRMREIKQRTRKALRIEALLPDIQNANLRFRRTLDSAVMDQFEMYPMHHHDDAPDAIEMSYRTARDGNVVFRTVRKRMR